MNYLLITSDPALLSQMSPFSDVVAMVDLETLGKKERQPGFSHHFSYQSVTDIPCVLEYLPANRLVVRVNPINQGSRSEIERVLEMGAKKIMLPMFKEANEVVDFIKIIDGRAQPILLAETIHSILKFETYSSYLPSEAEIHVGLNDLSLELKLPHMFEVLASGFVELAVEKFKRSNIKYGIGGVGLSSTDLVPFELVLSAHHSLGSSRVILSRSFIREAKSLGFAAAFSIISSCFRALEASTPKEFQNIAKEIRCRLV